MREPRLPIHGKKKNKPKKDKFKKYHVGTEVRILSLMTYRVMGYRGIKVLVRNDKEDHVISEDRLKKEITKRKQK